jgi:NADH-quinone oxidoreductase subunit N
MNLSVLLMNLKHITTELVIMATIVVVILLDLFRVKDNKSTLAYVSAFGLAVAAVICWRSNGIQLSIFRGALVVDMFGLYFKELLFIISGLTLLISMEYVRFRGINQGEFYVLILFATLGMMIMVCGADLLSIYLGLELNAIACCVLVGFLRRSVRSNEAALKYFILSLFSSGILLYGISLIYGVTGEINLYRIANYLSSEGDLSHPMLHFGLVLLMVGFGFKVAYVPFHMWVPDAYEGAPTSVAAFLSLGPKAAGLAVLIRILMIAVLSIELEWAKIFWILSVVTMTLGNVVALSQNNIKRLLAYSGIAHVGYMMIGLVAAAYSPRLGITSVAFYLLCYSFFNIGPFGIIILLCSKDKVSEFIEDFNGLSIRSPATALVMTIFLFSLAGLPPTGGFVAKFFIFAAAMKAKLYWLVIIGIVNTAIGLFYYLRIVVAMYVHEPKSGLSVNTSPGLVFALAIMVGVTLLAGIYPTWFVDFTRSSVAAVL